MTFVGGDITNPLEASADIYAEATVAGYRFPSSARAPDKSRVRALEDAVVALHAAVVKLAAEVERIDGKARAKR
jgi:hypothetical protein